MFQKLIISWEKWKFCPSAKKTEEKMIFWPKSKSKDTEMGNARCFRKWQIGESLVKYRLREQCAMKLSRQAGARP